MWFGKIRENKGNKRWMEGSAISEGTGRLLNHHLGYFSERFMLRWFAQLRLSSELGRFQCRGTPKI